jgi:segregation and condensation protein B
MEENDSKFESSVTEKELALMEAALYVAGHPLGIRTLFSIVGTLSKDKVLKLAQRLVEKYNKYNCALEILEVKEQRFVMQLKAEYSPKVRKLSFQSMLTNGPLRTLSCVEYHQPVLKTNVVEARGNHVYRHLKLLEEQNLIVRTGIEKTKVSRTTNSFADYFGLSHDLRALKRQIETLFKLE